MKQRFIQNWTMDTRSTPAVVNVIRDLILNACPDATLIVLFGSKARGDAGLDSDYDLRLRPG